MPISRTCSHDCRRSGPVRSANCCRISGCLPESRKVSSAYAYEIRPAAIFSGRALAFGLLVVSCLLFGLDAQALQYALQMTGTGDHRELKIKLHSDCFFDLGQKNDNPLKGMFENELAPVVLLISDGTGEMAVLVDKRVESAHKRCAINGAVFGIIMPRVRREVGRRVDQAENSLLDIDDHFFTSVHIYVP